MYRHILHDASPTAHWFQALDASDKKMIRLIGPRTCVGHSAATGSSDFQLKCALALHKKRAICISETSSANFPGPFPILLSYASDEFIDDVYRLLGSECHCAPV